MKTIKIFFHDDPAAPDTGLRDAVKAAATNNNGTFADVDSHKSTITCGDFSAMKAVWLELQTLAEIQISHNCSKEEHANLTKTTIDAQDAEPSKKKKKPQPVA